MKNLHLIGLFKKNNQNHEIEDDAWPFQTESPSFNSVIDHDAVLKFLVELPQSEFDKMVQVSEIYRAANAEVLQIFGTDDVDKDEELDNVIASVHQLQKQ